MMNIPTIMSITSGGALFLGFILLNHPQKVNKIANRWLGIFTITLGLSLLEVFLVSQNFDQTHPKYFELIGISRFLTAPALYLAILNFTSLEREAKENHFWHFLPLILILLFRIPFFFTGQNLEFSLIMSKIVFFVIQTTLPIQAVAYWIVCYQRLKKHGDNINKFSSTTEKINLSWLKSFLLLLLIVIFLWFNLMYFNIEVFKSYTPLLYLICVFFIMHFSLKQKEVFEFDQFEIKELNETISADKDNNKQKRITDNRAEILNEKLLELMENKKLFLDNELSLPILAKKMEATSNEVSFLINELYNENFNYFINKYRIEEAKTLLLSDKYSKLNILGIAYQSGFNSKTTFNITFKKISGHSPTEFIKSNVHR